MSPEKLTVKQLAMILLKEVKRGNGEAIVYVCDIQYETAGLCEVFDGCIMEDVPLDNGIVLDVGFPIYV